MGATLKSINVDVEKQKPQPVQHSNSEFAAALLAFEARVREIDDEHELFTHMCNDAKRILNFRQGFFFRSYVKEGAHRVCAATSIPIVDRDAPMMRWLEKIVARLSSEVGTDKKHYFTLPAYCDDTDEDPVTYPFAEFLWTPIKDGENVIGGFLATRETPWRETDQTLSQRIADLYTHAWCSIKGRGSLARKRIFTKKRSLLIAAVLGVIALIPVPMTALAPVKVDPLDPFIVAAPFEGVVQEIIAEQGAYIEAGDDLIQFDDVSQRNEAEIADRRASVADARLQRVEQSAIYDPAIKRELAVAKAEYDLALSEKQYADDILSKTKFKAPISGLAVYTDKRDWVGKPVQAGQAILQIADPQNIHFSIDLPVKESIVLKEGASVRVFLDSDPLKPIDAVLTQTSYQPRPDEQNILSYRLFATISKDDVKNLPRIGVKGTAQVKGNRVPFIYAVLRRPLSSLRQMTGL